MPPPSPATLTARRLNRACADLGLRLGGLDPFIVDDGAVRMRGRGFTNEMMADFATQLERLAERFAALPVTVPDEIPGQQSFDL